MEIGRARPLCCFFWIVSGVVALYAIASPSTALMTACACVAALLAVLTVALSMRPLPSRYRLRYLAFLLLAVFVGFSVTTAHEQLVARPICEYTASLEAQTDTLEGTVVSCEVESSYLRCYGVRVDLDGLGSRLLYLSTTSDRALSVGDRIGFTARVLPIEQAEEEEWLIRSLRTDGYALVGYLEEGSACTVTDTERFVLREWLGGIQTALSHRLTRAVGQESGRLVSALLLGSKSELSDQTTLDFRRAGASHLLVISGMHLSLIVLLIDALLRKLRCPYLVRLSLVSLVAVCFLGITGCSISTLRATVMLLCLNLSRLRGAPHDAMTPLSVFFGLCLCLCPAWIYDAGLWLTVLATLCVIEIVPAVLRRKKKAQASRMGDIAWRYLATPLLASCLVLIVLIIPMALLFGEVSVLSPISNLLLSPLVTALLALGLFTLPLLFLPASPAIFAVLVERLSDALRFLADAMLSITARLSDVRGALVSLRYGFAPVLLVILLAVLLAFLFLRWKRPHRFFAVAALWCAAYAVCLVITSISSLGQWEMSYTASKSNELLTLREGSTAVVCDMTDGSYTAYRALLEDGLPPSVTEIESLVLTHYHNRHISTVYRLLGDIKVRTLWLPMTMAYTDSEKAVSDEGIQQSIASLARLYGVDVRYYIPNESVQILDTLTLERLYFEMIGRSTHPTLALAWTHQGKDGNSSLFYLGASAWEGKASEPLLEAMAQADAIVLAGHGPIIKTDYTVPAWEGTPRLLVVASDAAIAALSPNRETEIALSFTDVVVARGHLRVRLP